MNLDIFKHLFEALKLAPKYLIAICVVLGFLLFAPADRLEWFSVADVAKDYRPWFGLGFLSSAVLLAVAVGVGLYGFCSRRVGKWQRNRKIRERLGRLTEDEKQILRFYIAKQTRTNTLRHTDGVVQGLAAAGVIFRASTMGNLVEGFAYNLNQVAWDVLNEDPTVLNGTTDTYRTDKRTHWMQ